MATLHGGVLLPDDFAIKRQFGDRFDLLIGRNIEIGCTIFDAHFDAVSTTLKLFAKGPNEPTAGVENKDRGVIRECWIPLVNDLEVVFGVNGNIMSSLP